MVNGLKAQDLQAEADRVAISIGRSWMAQSLYAKLGREADRRLLSKIRATEDDSTGTLNAVNAWRHERVDAGRHVTDETITAALVNLGQRRR